MPYAWGIRRWSAGLCSHMHCRLLVWGQVSVSIRMCRDCHECFKAASAHYGKRISCDDRSNLHVFEGGVCSCGERWR